MTIKDFAEMLNNREYRKEITFDECAQAKQLGFVVVFGASDDLMEFRGAIDEEVGAYDGTYEKLTSDGLVKFCECDCVHYQNACKNAKTLNAIWGEQGYSFIYEFNEDIPTAEFDIIQDGEKYCRGIVFELKSL